MTSLQRRKILRLIKYGWMILVIIALIWYVKNHGHRLLDVINQTSSYKLFMAWTGILIGKACALYLMAASLRVSGHPRAGMRNRIWIYSSSDLAKYMPGGVWAVVGRVIHYRNANLSPLQISKALFIENFGFVITAFAFGLPAGLLIIQRGFPESRYFLLFGLLVSALLACAALRWAQRFAQIHTATVALRRSWRALLVMAGGWAAMGTSFYLLIPSPFEWSAWLWLAGAYAAAFAAGMVAVFAPAGAGIREAALVMAGQTHGLAGTLMLDAAILNRGLWVIADISFFILALATSRK